MLYVNLNRIHHNPWQTRQMQDDDGLQELVADIEARRATRPTTKGLLQVPAGRLITPGGQAMSRSSGYSVDKAGQELTMGQKSLQLVFGHRRLAAFQILAEKDHFWRHMPVELVWFDDEEMATAAWAENWKRQDLTPMEQANAIALMMEDFHWTQAQVGERLGLARSTIAHKLGLLKLPVDQRVQVQQGMLSERQALALLPVVGQPEPEAEEPPPWRQEAAREIVEKAPQRSSDEIRQEVKRIVEAPQEELPPPAIEIVDAEEPAGFDTSPDGRLARALEQVAMMRRALEDILAIAATADPLTAEEDMMQIHRVVCRALGGG